MIELTGGWSYSTKQIINLIPHLPSGRLKVLELGSGDSTGKICDYFISTHSDITFYSYETSKNYLSNHPKVIGKLYESVESCILPEEVFDLILVDGPTGEVRKEWYAKLKSVSKIGTIIHIDDFCHYESFRTNLDSNFQYEILDHAERENRAEHCWRTVKVTKIL